MITPGEGILEPDDKAWGPEAYQTLRQTIRRRLILDSHLAQDDIKAYRENVLRGRGVQSDFDDWKVIGLAQRGKGSRQWTNLDKNLKGCNKAQALRENKIVCIEVGISNSYQQVIARGALDGLIGIHGEELTETVWMKPGALVVEFLPWMHPEANEGKSVRSVKEVTPLGAILSNSDLNHLGYPLQRKSAPYCQNLKGTEETNCWLKNVWGNQHFEGTTESIVDAVTMFFVKPTQSCTEYQELAADNYVLYNLHCKTGDDNVPSSPQHFFWEKDLFEIPKFTDY
jgi:hypothetical protein